MTRSIGSAAALLLLATTALAQTTDRIYTRPAVPSREALDRLNLTVEWRVYLPVEGKRDGIFSVQLPDKYVLVRMPDGSLAPSWQILAQTNSGLVIALERETGQVLWRSLVGVPYHVNVPLAVNSRSVIVNSGPFVYALDRMTGALQWRYPLLPVPSATPMVDEQRMYIDSPTGRMYAYLLPEIDVDRGPLSTEAGPVKKADQLPKTDRQAYFERLPPLNPVGGVREGHTAEPVGPQPTIIWETVNDLHGYLTPLQTSRSWFLVTASGWGFQMNKIVGKEEYRFKTDGPITLQPDQHGDVAYIASGDNNLYAVDMPGGETLWNYTTGSTIVQRPEVTDDDVFIVTEGVGLMRLDRQTGLRRWRKANADAYRFLAVNPKFVYAVDRPGNLLILDAARGTELSRYDTRGFVFPVSNRHTDRLLLASHDGLLICLRDLDYRLPVVNRKPVVKEEIGPTNPIYNKLRDNITLVKGLPDQTVKEALDFFSKQYRLPYIVSEDAFREAGQPNFLEKHVSLPRVDPPRPLDEVMHEMLKPVGATFLIQADHILIVPRKGGAEAPPAPAGAPPAPEKAPPAPPAEKP